MKTSPHPRPSDDEAIEARAAAWLAQRDDGLAAEEEATFTRWRAADPRHDAAVTRLETVWTALRQLRDFRPAARSHPDRDLLAPARRRLLVFPSLALAAAAAALVLALVWKSADLPLPTGIASTKIYTTTAAGFQRLTLSDGSVVELNDQTEVRVRYAAAERRVQLVRGEAHFTVAKNRARPFYVETAAVSVRAVGTAFDVRLEPAQVQVLVTEGRVQLERHLFVAPSDAEPPVLAAGWRALVPNRAGESLVLEQLPPDRMHELLSWQGPRLFFVETPLAEVVAQFNRRNEIQLSLADPELAGIPVGGSFRAENVETFVRLLASNGEIVVERPAPGRIVLHKAR